MQRRTKRERGSDRERERKRRRDRERRREREKGLADMRGRNQTSCHKNRSFYFQHYKRTFTLND